MSPNRISDDILNISTVLIELKCATERLRKIINPLEVSTVPTVADALLESLKVQRCDVNEEL